VSILVGGPFDGREFDAKGMKFVIPCRDFYADPPGAEPYIARTFAVYELRDDGQGPFYFFSHEYVPDDGYRAPVKS